MKKLILLLFVPFLSYSQDRIYTHKGDSIICKVIEMGEKTIKFKYEGEEFVDLITKNLVSQIKFASGRVQKVTDKIIITSELDWEKVIITNVESDVEGLERVGEMMAKASSGWSTTNQGKLQKKAMNKLKKQAAEQGCHIILILTTTGKGGHFGMSGGAKQSITGVGYKY